MNISSLFTLVNSTTAPWILGAIAFLVLLTLTRVFTSWRQTKRSPYFFLRQQAEKRLQAYLWTVLVLIAFAGGTVAFAWQTPPDTTVRMALIATAKPVTDEEAGLAAMAEAEDELPVIALDDLPQVSQNDGGVSLTEGLVSVAVPSEGPLPRPSAAADLPLSATRSLPDEFDQFEPEAELSEATEMTPLLFSTEVDDDYNPVSPRRLFGEGFFTLYATFDYDGMADGMAWAWIWRRNGEVVNGGNELWNYGDDGPGWIYYEPPEGFSPGEYTLEVWVNGELFQQAGLTIESEVAN